MNFSAIVTLELRTISTGFPGGSTNGAKFLFSVRCRGRNFTIDRQRLFIIGFSRIEKAIILDNLKPVTSDSKHSSSAVDTLTVLYSVKRFWEDLKRPDQDYAVKIDVNVSGDICRFAAIYFDNIVDRVVKSDVMKHFGIFQVPLEVYVAVCNINFVNQEIQKLLKPAENQVQETDRIQKVLQNVLKHGTSRSEKLIQASIKKMVPSMRKLLLEGADVVTRENRVGERVIVYVGDELINFQKVLYEEDFNTARKFMWESILDVFVELISTSLEFKRQPIFYSNLKTILEELHQACMSPDEVDKLDGKKQEICFLLERHCLNTSKLIHRYFKERYHMQQDISKSPFHPYGVLSIHCFFFHNTLKIEILNAKNLIPIGGTKKCDSFVKINIIPEENFAKCQNYKTRVVIDTHFPLYDEFFEM